MRVGFTGSQGGMSKAQRTTVSKVLQELKPRELRHGDCVGADAEVHDIALSLNIPVVIHPPTESSKRAFCQGAAAVRPVESYMVRNDHIVRSTHLLVAAPPSRREVLRSGTWATVRRARTANKIVIFVYPDGTRRVETRA